MRRGTRSGEKAFRRQGVVRRLAQPDPVKVRERPHGRPASVDGKAVEAIRDTWLVEDRWWTGAPIKRHYWEVLTEGGAIRVIYREPSGRWLAHG